MSREQKIKDFMKKEGLNTLNEINLNNDGFFSSQGCAICDDHVCNTVFDCHGFNSKTREVQDGYQICFKCLHFINYGEEID